MTAPKPTPAQMTALVAGVERGGKVYADRRTGPALVRAGWAKKRGNVYDITDAGRTVAAQSVKGMDESEVAEAPVTPTPAQAYWINAALNQRVFNNGERIFDLWGLPVRGDVVRRMVEAGWVNNMGEREITDAGRRAVGRDVTATPEPPTSTETPQNVEPVAEDANAPEPVQDVSEGRNEMIRTPRGRWAAGLAPRHDAQFRESLTDAAQDVSEPPPAVPAWVEALASSSSWVTLAARDPGVRAAVQDVPATWDETLSWAGVGMERALGEAKATVEDLEGLKGPILEPCASCWSCGGTGKETHSGPSGLPMDLVCEACQGPKLSWAPASGAEALESVETATVPDPARPRCVPGDVVRIHRGTRLYEVLEVRDDEDLGPARVVPCDPTDERDPQWVHLDLLHVVPPLAEIRTTARTGWMASGERFSTDLVAVAGAGWNPERGVLRQPVTVRLFGANRAAGFLLAVDPGLAREARPLCVLRVGDSLMIDGDRFAVTWDGGDAEPHLEPARQRVSADPGSIRLRRSLGLA